MFASPINSLTVVSELLVVFFGVKYCSRKGTIHVYGIVHVYDTIHVYDIVHVYDTVHEKRWEQSKNFYGAKQEIVV